MIRGVDKLPDELAIRIPLIRTVAIIVAAAEAETKDIQFISYLEEGESFFQK